MTQHRLTFRSFGLLMLLALTWGSSFFFYEVALQALPPVTITLHRVGWSIPILWFVLWATKHPLPKGVKLWSAYLVMGLLNNLIPFTLIAWGQQSIESGLAAILNGTTAFFGALVAGLLLSDERLTFGKLAGAAIGLIGVAAIMGPGALAGFDLRNLGQLAILGAALSYAFAGVWSRKRLAGQPPLANAFGMIVASTGLTALLQLALHGAPDLNLPATVWATIFCLAALSTALAYILYFKVLAVVGAANLYMVTLLIPPVAIVLGAVLLDETLPNGAGLGFALIAAGLLVSDGRIFGWMRSNKKPASM